ncbi:MAG: VWA domain-containing protein [Flavobacterium sp.]|nr:VWA domain-containing protein [Flavobacterium sp.]
MELDEKKYLYLLLLLPILAVIFLNNQYWKKKKQQEFGDLDLVKKLSPEKSIFKPVLKFVLVCLAILCLIIGLVNPKIGSRVENIKREGIDIVFAIDVSKSMVCEDIAPNRLEKSKQLVSQIMTKLGDDRVGIIAYAGSAYPVLPITTDFNSAKMMLQSMNTDMLSSVGTSLVEAINLSAQFFEKENKTSKLMIMITDGEDHTQGSEQAADEAKKLGLKIITIGMGTQNGGPIPLKENGRLLGYKNDKQGNQVVTKMNPDILKKIAKSTNGGYISGNNTKDVVEFVDNELNKIQKTAFASTQMTNYQAQFQWFLGFAFFILLLDVFLLERKTAWAKKADLFNEKSSS